MKFRDLLLICAVPMTVHADGIAIDKIYHPYVDALEHELEYRALLPDRLATVDEPAQLHRVSLGTALASTVFAELYAVAEKPRAGGFDISAWEGEVKWQLTEQGEYSADFGLLFEYESGHNADEREFAATLLAEKEWGRWSGAANIHLISEWGEDVADEFETALGVQLRYRHSRLLEPGIEFYAAQDTLGIGPVLQGTFNTGVRRNVHWEAGLIAGLDSATPDTAWRFLLEYEF